MDVRERFIFFQTLLIYNKCIHGLADYLTSNVLMEYEVCLVSKRKHEMNLYIPFPDNTGGRHFYAQHARLVMSFVS